MVIILLAVLMYAFAFVFDFSFITDIFHLTLASYAQRGLNDSSDFGVVDFVSVVVSVAISFSVDEGRR